MAPRPMSIGSMAFPQGTLGPRALAELRDELVEEATSRRL